MTSSLLTSKEEVFKHSNKVLRWARSEKLRVNEASFYRKHKIPQWQALLKLKLGLNKADPWMWMVVNFLLCWMLVSSINMSWDSWLFSKNKSLSLILIKGNFGECLLTHTYQYLGGNVYRVFFTSRYFRHCSVQVRDKKSEYCQYFLGTWRPSFERGRTFLNMLRLNFRSCMRSLILACSCLKKRTLQEIFHSRTPHIFNIC